MILRAFLLILLHWNSPLIQWHGQYVGSICHKWCLFFHRLGYFIQKYIRLSLILYHYGLYTAKFLQLRTYFFITRTSVHSWISKIPVLIVFGLFNLRSSSCRIGSDLIIWSHSCAYNNSLITELTMSRELISIFIGPNLNQNELEDS